MGGAEWLILGWLGWESWGAFEDVRGLHQAVAIYQVGQQRATDQAKRHEAAALIIGNLYRQKVEETNEVIKNSSDPCRDLPADIGRSMVNGWRQIIARPVGVLAKETSVDR